MTYRVGGLPTGACPRCYTPLQAYHPDYGTPPNAAARDAAHTLMHCASCGGIWLGVGLSARVMAKLDHSLLTTAHALSIGKPEHVTSRVERTPMCTECGRELEPLTVQAAVVRIDVCREHGTWFDAWELPKVMRAFARAHDNGVSPTDRLPNTLESKLVRAETVAMRQTALDQADAQLEAAAVQTPQSSVDLIVRAFGNLFRDE